MADVANLVGPPECAACWLGKCWGVFAVYELPCGDEVATYCVNDWFELGEAVDAREVVPMHVSVQQSLQCLEKTLVTQPWLERKDGGVADVAGLCFVQLVVPPVQCGHCLMRVFVDCGFAPFFVQCIERAQWRFGAAGGFAQGKIKAARGVWRCEWMRVGHRLWFLGFEQWHADVGFVFGVPTFIHFDGVFDGGFGAMGGERIGCHVFDLNQYALFINEPN